jgi:nucleoside triphosphate pyrophosphatase
MSAGSVVLASASPRRRELLAQLGVAFDVVPSAVPEIPQSGEPAEVFAQRVAREKATEVARQCPGSVVLGADTVVVIDDTILNKPGDRNDARRMLRMLSGRSHCVLTAVALIDPSGQCDELLVQSEVEFRPLSARDIEEYLDTGEPFDKAGAYGVQGFAKQFVVAVRGSYSNVVGLPIDEVIALLRRHVPHCVNTDP